MNRIIIFDFNRTLYDPDKKAIVPGAIRLLEEARSKGYVLVLLSKAASDRAELVEELGITPYFREIIFAGKKSHELFEGVAKRHDADKTKSYVIGDRAQGEIKFGQAGGWRTIWLKSGKFASELPAPDQQPDHVVTNLDQMYRLI